jgi:hypothetical protein
MPSPNPAASIWRCASGGALRRSHRFPPRIGIYDDLRLSIVVRSVGHKVGFEFRQREMLPFPGLAQERASLNGAEARGLTVQRSYRAISAHVFQDGFPAGMHECDLPCFPFARHKCRPKRFSISLARFAESPNGFSTVDRHV